MMESAGKQDLAKHRSFRDSLPSMFLLTFIFFLNFVSRIIFAPLLPQIEQELGISHAVSGSFFLYISSGYFISIILSGSVAEKIGNQRTIVLSAISCGLMLFVISISESLTGIRCGLFFLGYGAGLYLQAGLATILNLVAPSYLARGMAVHELAPNLGFVVAPLLSSLVLSYMDWRNGLQCFAISMGFAAGLYWAKGPRGGATGKSINLHVVRDVLLLREFWYLVLLFSFAICSTLGIYAMLPLYLVTEHGMEHDHANTLVAVSRISSVFMPLAGGWLGDRFGNRMVLLTVLFVAGLLTIPLGFSSGVILLVFVVLQPVIAVMFFPSGFAVLTKLGGEKLRGAAVSLGIPLAFFVGAGIIPALIGLIGDKYSLALGFSIAGCSMTVISVAVGLKMKKLQTSKMKFHDGRHS